MEKGIIAFALAAAFAASASAEITVPHRIHPTINTVAEVVKDAKHEDWVILKGVLEHRKDVDLYDFKDVTGRIDAVVAKELIAGRAVRENVPLEVVARVTRLPFEAPLIEVERIEPAAR